jgi:hypothetical protein
MAGASTDGLTGVVATGAQGTTAADLTKALTGTSSTAQAGTIFGAQRLQGTQAAYSTGSLLFTQSLIGQAISATFGFLDEYEGYPLTGTSINVTPGVVGADLLHALTGSSAAASTGILSIAKGLSSQTFPASAGSLSAIADKAITGVSSTTSQGTAAAALTSGLSGSGLVATDGSIVDSETILLATHTIVPVSGTTVPDSGIALAGRSIATSQGELSPSSATLADLVGEFAQAHASSVTASSDRQQGGLQGTSSQGVVAPGINVSLTGAQVEATQTGVTQSRSQRLTGQRFDAFVNWGIPTPDIPLVGRHLPISPGVLGISESLDTVLNLAGSSFTASHGALAASVEEIIQSLGGGSYDSFGADIRSDIVAKKNRELMKEWLALAEYEDNLLLATVRTTLENPKYGF